MKYTRHAGIIAMLSLMSGCASLSSNVEPTPIDPELRSAHSAAVRAMQALEARFARDEPAVPGFVDYYCRSSERVWDLERQLSSNDGQKRAALAAHRTRLEKFLRQFAGRTDGANWPTQLIDYHLAMVALEEKRLNK